MDTLIEEAFRVWMKSSVFVCMEVINYLRIAPYVSNLEEHTYLANVLKRIVA